MAYPWNDFGMKYGAHLFLDDEDVKRRRLGAAGMADFSAVSQHSD